MSITGMITKMAAPAPKPENFSRYLFIGPHPDDIEIGAGATVAKLAAEGKDITYLICIDGRFGDENAPEGMTTQELISTRHDEAVAAAAALGVKNVEFLELCDGGLYDEQELFRKMAEAVGRIKPEIIFCPDPDVKSECHVDHLRVGRAAKQLAFLAPFEKIMKEYGAESAPIRAVAMYMTARPNRYVRTGGYLARQLEVLRTQFPSQYPAGCPALDSVMLYLKLRAHEYGLRKRCRSAEGFRVLGTTQMHCLPEAGE